MSYVKPDRSKKRKINPSYWDLLPIDIKNEIIIIRTNTAFKSVLAQFIRKIIQLRMILNVSNEIELSMYWVLWVVI